MKNIFNLVVVTLFIISCNKTKTNTYPVINSSQTVYADIVGQIIDETGKPIIGATVKTGNNTYITDSSGAFMFINVLTTKERTIVEVSKQNFYKGFRTMYIIAKEDNYTRIMLIEKKAPSTFLSTTGGDIEVVGGGKIIFEPNSIINKNTGELYSGNVNVYSTLLDPTDENIHTKLPGALRAISADTKEKILETYGMIGVEMYDDNNQALQIATNKTAEIIFPIPASIKASAPNIIPLWYFDETIGMWIEEGEAQIQGNNYVGKVSHFTFWNFDIPSDFVQLEATLKTSNGTPIVNVKVKITNLANNSSRISYTNSFGRVEGAVPINANLLFEVLLSECNTNIFSQNINTTTSDVSLNNIIINPPVLNNAVVSGTLLNCFNDPIKNGYIKFFSNNEVKILKVSDNGNFVYNFLECVFPATIQFTPIDYANNTFGNTQNFQINNGYNNIGNLIACGQTYSQFIKWENNINGVKSSYTITDILGLFVGTPYFRIKTGPDMNGISGTDTFSYQGITIAFDGSPSINGNHYLMYYGDHLDKDIDLDTTYSYINSIIPVYLSKYDTVGGKIEGSFEGYIQGHFIPNRNVKCNFSVKRTY